MGEGQQPFTYLLTAISQAGFPIVLTAYLLTRFEKKLDKLTESKRAKVRKSMENDLFDLVQLAQNGNLQALESIIQTFFPAIRNQRMKCYYWTSRRSCASYCRDCY